MIISENIFAMLLVEKFFKTFIKNEITDSAKSTEVILALSLKSRAKVDEMIRKVVNARGLETRVSQDHGWMYGRGFQTIVVGFEIFMHT